MPKIALQKQRWCVEVMSKANNREVEAAGSEGLPGEQRTNLFLMLVVFSLEGLSTFSPIDLSGVSQSAAVWKDQISQLFSQQLEEAVGTPVSAGAGFLPCAAWCLGINSHTLWPCLFPPPPALQLSTYSNEVPRSSEGKDNWEEGPCLFASWERGVLQLTAMPNAQHESSLWPLLQGKPKSTFKHQKDPSVLSLLCNSVTGLNAYGVTLYCCGRSV